MAYGFESMDGLFVTADSGAGRIARERRRQVEEEGYDAEHDDLHASGQLVLQAVALARGDTGPLRDIWGLAAKHGSRIRKLEIAGALIAAEIDRLQRAKEQADRRREASMSETTFLICERDQHGCVNGDHDVLCILAEHGSHAEALDDVRSWLSGGGTLTLEGQLVLVEATIHPLVVELQGEEPRTKPDTPPTPPKSGGRDVG